MTIKTETELKYRLEGVEAFRRICEKLGPPAEEWEQVNHYYQSADGRIPGKRGVIRIRSEKGQAVFTVKLEGILERGVARSMEFEFPWRGDSRQFPPSPESLWGAGHPGMEALAAECGHRFPLVRVGEMINRRKVFPFSGDLLLEIDASRYPDGETDYEVELETADPERDRILLLRVLDEAGVHSTQQTETKYQRFLRHVV